VEGVTEFSRSPDWTNCNRGFNPNAADSRNEDHRLVQTRAHCRSQEHDARGRRRCWYRAGSALEVNRLARQFHNGRKFFLDGTQLIEHSEKGPWRSRLDDQPLAFSSHDGHHVRVARTPEECVQPDFSHSGTASHVALEWQVGAWLSYARACVKCAELSRTWPSYSPLLIYLAAKRFHLGQLWRCWTISDQGRRHRPALSVAAMAAFYLEAIAQTHLPSR
jgi:hypothetical protein